MRRNVNTQTIEQARELRKNLSLAEEHLWSRIRGRQLLGFQVRRQFPIGPYIADFCIPKLKLVIELDGSSHDDRVEDDAARDRYIEEQRFTVLRFQNRDIMEKLDGVLEYLWDYCGRRIQPPS